MSNEQLYGLMWCILAISPDAAMRLTAWVGLIIWAIN